MPDYLTLFAANECSNTGAYFWDQLISDIPAWSELKYEWIANSIYGDQIVLTSNSPLHLGSAVYLLGPDVAGPKTDNPDWPEDLIYLGSSVDEWLLRVKRFGDEYSIAPGAIEECLESPEEYRELYRTLNPGLRW